MAPNRIRAIREAQSKTREDLGKAIQKSALTIWRYEEGKTDIPLSSLQRMAQALAVPLEALLSERRRKGRNEVAADV